MKKCVLVLFSLFFLSVSVFAQSEVRSVQNNSEHTEFKASVLDENLLVHSPCFLNITQYENPSGKKFSNKEVNFMLDEVPENKAIMKSYRFWLGMTYTLAGLCAAGLTTGVVYSFNENAPYANEIYASSMYTAICACAGALLTSSISSSKYLKAVDNYNLSILKN